MSVCQHASCVPGSKVSYTIFAPVKNPDFEGFKLAQQRVAAQLRQRVPEGTVVNFGTPKRTTDQLFTIFTNTRVVHATNGAKQFTKSTLLHSKKITISVISSSEDKEAVEANRALFMIGLMTWSQSIGKNKQ